MTSKSTSCLDSSIFNEKLKQKITTQAKRLTKLATEKEELLELLREKTTIDSSFNSVLLSTNMKAKSCTIDLELEKSKIELASAKEKIKDLEKSKEDLILFKETISNRLAEANEDIERTKKALNDIQKEKDALIEKNKENIIEIEKVKEENDILKKEVTKLQNEKMNLVKQIKEAQNDNRGKKENEEQLIETNNKLFQDNKELVCKVRKLSNENNTLKNDNIYLKKTNFDFSQKIDNLTKTVNNFHNELNKTLKISTSIEIENKKNEFINIIKAKDIEIVKLTELNKNYLLLEKELNKAIKEKVSLINNYKKQIEEQKRESEKVKKGANLLREVNLEFEREISQLKCEIQNIKKSNLDIVNRLQSASNLKNTQIENLKKYSQILEEKTISIGKNKKYLEHLLIYTHPKSEELKQILDIYNEIVGLEMQKKNFEKEFMDSLKDNQDNSNKLIQQKALNNIEDQIQMLKESLHKMEEEIKY